MSSPPAIQDLSKLMLERARVAALSGEGREAKALVEAYLLLTPWQQEVEQLSKPPGLESGQALREPGSSVPAGLDSKSAGYTTEERIVRMVLEMGLGGSSRVDAC